LKHTKDCHDCREKRNKNKKTEKEEENENATRKRRAPLGKDTSVKGPPTVSLAAFISLLEGNKEKAFEIHTFVQLSGLESNSGHDCAIELSKMIWNATGFRFKYVQFQFA
jgi:hypothetical protein